MCVIDCLQEWAQALEHQMVSEDTAQDLTTVNVAMQKQQMIESEMVKRAHQIDSLQVNFYAFILSYTIDFSKWNHN